MTKKKKKKKHVIKKHVTKKFVTFVKKIVTKKACYV